jgi:hypothetical protein
MMNQKLKNISALIGVFLIVALMFVSGPVSAMNITMTASGIDDDGDGTVEPGETVVVTANVTIANGEHIPIKNVTFDVSGTNTLSACQLPINSSGYTDRTVNCGSVNLIVNMTKGGEFGYGYAYGYINTFNGTGYGYYWWSETTSPPYWFNETGYGYGYSGWNGDQYGAAATWFKFTIKFTAPSTWSTGSNTARVKITMPDSSDSGTTDDEVYATTSFSLSSPSTTTTTGGGGGGSINITTTTVAPIPDTVLINELLKIIDPSDLGLTSLSADDVEVTRIGTTVTETVTSADIEAALAAATSEDAKAKLNAVKALLDAGDVDEIAVTKTLDVYKVSAKDTGKEVYVSRVTISYAADSAKKNVNIIEVIPKTVVVSADELEFVGLVPTILQQDPIVQWELAGVDKGETVELKYLVKKQLSGIDSTTVAVAKAAPVVVTTVPVVPPPPIIIPDYLWLLIAIIILIIAGVVLYHYRSKLGFLGNSKKK